MKFCVRMASNSFSVFAVVGVSSIFHVWTFDSDLEYWTNDDDIGSQKWLPVPDLRALCLSAKVPSASAYEPKRPAWMSENEDNSVDTSTDLKARLRSPRIPAKVNMRCLAITYGIFFHSDLTYLPGASLAVLERRDRCLNLSIFGNCGFDLFSICPELSAFR